MQAVIPALPLHQLGVVSHLHHSPLIHEHDHVRRPHGGQAVSDEEDGPPPEGVEQVEAHLALGAGIQGAGGLIQDQQTRVLQHGPGQGHALPLTAG